MQTTRPPESYERSGLSSDVSCGFVLITWNASRVLASLRFAGLARFQGLPVFILQKAAKIAELARALQELASIHANDFTVDVGRAVADEKRSEIGQFLDSAKTMERIAIERDRFELRIRHQAGKRSLGWDRSGRDGIHANAAVTPLHRQTPGKGLDSGLGDRRRDYIGRAYGGVSRRNTQHGAGAFAGQPAASASRGAVQRAHEHDADDGLPGARREILAAGDEISRGVVDKNVERILAPDGVHHGLDRIQAADIARDGVNRAFGRELGGSLFKDV